MKLGLRREESIGRGMGRNTGAAEEAGNRKKAKHLIEARSLLVSRGDGAEVRHLSIQILKPYSHTSVRVPGSATLKMGAVSRTDPAQWSAC